MKQLTISRVSKFLVDMALIETGSWRIQETRDGRGSVHEITNRGLTIGRHADADIIVHSRTVDQHHACIQWDSLNKCFSIRDLDSVNGTFVNKKLLRGESHLLNDGDALRFGYDMQQSFRVEKAELPPPVSQTQATAGTQTSLQHNVTPPLAPSMAQAHLQAPPPQPLMPHPQFLYQYSPVAQPTAMVVSSPTFLPQMISYGLGPSTNQYMALPALPTVQPIPATPTAQPVTATPTIQPVPATPTTQPVPATPTVQPVPATPTVQAPSPSGGAGSMSKDKKIMIRWDGRRQIPIEDTPSLLKVSGLYGQPRWWGEEDDCSRSGGLSDSELSPLRRSGQILRDLDTSKSEDEGVKKKRGHRRVLQEKSQSPCSSLGDVRKEATRSATSFTVAFEAPKRARPPRLRGQRPVSASWLEKRSVPLPTQRTTPYAKTRCTPSEASMAARKPPSGVKRQSLRSKTVHPEESPLLLNWTHTVTPLSGQGLASSHPNHEHSTLPSTSYSVSPNFEPEGLSSSPTSSVHQPLEPTSSPVHIDHLPSETGPSPAHMDHLPPETAPSSAHMDHLPPGTAPSPAHMDHLPPGTAPSPAHMDHLPPETAPSSAHMDHLPPGTAPSPAHMDHLPPGTAPSPAQAALPLQSLSESALGACRSVSQPASHYGTPHGWSSTKSESGSRPSSARKQWQDELSEVPYGLMLAAIAARTKRVAESAQKTAELVLASMSSLQVAGVATPPTAVFDSLSNSVSLKLPLSGLPQWTFVNKDFTNIFKNLRSIEKALKDMMEPVATMKEEVDYLTEEDSSDGEAPAVHDDIEDQLAVEADNESDG